MELPETVIEPQRNDEATEEDRRKSLRDQKENDNNISVAEVNVGWQAEWMALLLKVFIFLDGCTHNGLTHFVNVYLVVIEGWKPFEASWIWFTRDMVMLLCQTCAGNFVDKTEYKKSMLASIGTLKIISGIIMLTTTAMAPQIIKGAIDGATNTLVIPVTTALTLGAVGKTKFHRKHAQLNIMVKNLGVSLSSIILGFVAYSIYPDIRNVFYQFVAVGILCLLCVLGMPNTNDAIDHDVARGRSNLRLVRSSMNSLMSSFQEEEHDYEKEETTANDQNTDVENKVAASGYTEILSIRDMFKEPTRRSSLLYLSLTFFSYHLVNATVLPLLGQYIGLEEKRNEHARSVLPSMTALIVMKELGSFFTNWLLKSRIRTSMYKCILTTGCCILLLRLALISILIRYTDNLWALGCTNILEGVAIGCLDLMLTLYSHLLSRQTGHYNLNMGIVSTFKTFGSALSVLIGGALVDTENYDVAFPILTCMVLIPTFFSTLVNTPNLYGKVQQ